jgi:hypothetical protein
MTRSVPGALALPLIETPSIANAGGALRCTGDATVVVGRGHRGHGFDMAAEICVMDVMESRHSARHAAVVRSTTHHLFGNDRVSAVRKRLLPFPLCGTAAVGWQ